MKKQKCSFYSIPFSAAYKFFKQIPIQGEMFGAWSQIRDDFFYFPLQDL